MLSADVRDDTQSNGGLGAADLASNSVGATEVADLATGSVRGPEILDGAVGNADLGSNAVTATKVTNETLTTADIAGASVSGHVNLNGIPSAERSRHPTGARGAHRCRFDAAGVATALAASTYTGRGVKMTRLKSKLTFANVCSFLALTIALGTGGAYAANTIGSDDIIDESIQSVDIKNGQVHGSDVGNNQVSSADVRDDTLTNGGLGAADLGADSVAGSEVSDGSLTSSDLGVDSVQAIQIADNTIDGGEIIDNSLGSNDLATDSVGGSELADNSVASANVSNDSLTLTDILGANVNGSIGFSLGANSCGNLSLGISGAQVGQVVLFSFTGSTAVPTTVAFGGVKVTAANTVVVRACNVGSSAMSVSNLGIHVVTFG